MKISYLEIADCYYLSLHSLSFRVAAFSSAFSSLLSELYYFHRGEMSFPPGSHCQMNGRNCSNVIVISAN